MALLPKSLPRFLLAGCSYFAARSMAEEAQLVFCPYNYIINSAIRRAMEVDLKDSIVILDEAQYAPSSYRSLTICLHGTLLTYVV